MTTTAAESLLASVTSLMDGWAPHRPVEREAKDVIRGHLDRYPTNPAARDCSGGHLTASVMLVHVPTDAPAGDGVAEARTLLTLHPRFGRWMQLGGHLEAGETAAEVTALRETYEESGQQHRQVTAFLGAGVFDNVRCSGTVTRHLDLRYLVLTDSLSTTCSDESLDLAWWSLSRLPAPHDGDLALLAEQALEHLASPAR